MRWFVFRALNLTQMAFQLWRSPHVLVFYITPLKLFFFFNLGAVGAICDPFRRRHQLWKGLLCQVCMSVWSCCHGDGRRRRRWWAARGAAFGVNTV